MAWLGLAWDGDGWGVLIQRLKGQKVPQHVARRGAMATAMTMKRSWVPGHPTFLVVLGLGLLTRLALGLGTAGLGHLDGSQAVSIEQCLLQRPGATLGARGCVTLSPASKLVLAVSPKILLPVAGHFTLVLLGVLIACSLSNPCTTIANGRGTSAILPLSAISAWLLPSLFFLT